MEPFSRRHGLRPAPAPIAVRHDAPPGLRDAVSQIAQEAGMPVDSVREVVCRVLGVRPEPNNWSAGNVEGEVYGLIGRCEWLYVYDAIELPGAWLRERQGGDRGDACYDVYEREMNLYFEKEGIGWALRDAQLQVRGDGALRGSTDARGGQPTCRRSLDGGDRGRRRPPGPVASPSARRDRLDAARAGRRR